MTKYPPIFALERVSKEVEIALGVALLARTKLENMEKKNA